MRTVACCVAKELAMVEITEKMKVRMQMAEVDRQIYELKIRRDTLGELYKDLWPNEIIADEVDDGDGGKADGLRISKNLKDAISSRLNRWELKSAERILKEIRDSRHFAYKELNALPEQPLYTVEFILQSWVDGELDGAPEGIISGISESASNHGSKGYKIKKRPYTKSKKKRK